MQMNREQANAAVNAGLALTDPEEDLLDVFRKHSQGIFLLRALLQALASGQVVLSSPEQTEPGVDEPEPPETPKKK